jgi:hypothetical protein
MEAVVKPRLRRWQRVAAIAQAVRMIEQRIKATARDDGDTVILEQLAVRMRAQLARERLAWEGVTDDARR